ncbi:MAG: cytochrome c oxidase assembly protein [Pseudomonadota bacterium]
MANRAGNLILQLAALSVGMFAFGFALVPLYDVFCDITGLGGRTNDTAAVVTEAPDPSREVTVEFVTTVNEYAPWEFEATVDRMTVHPGKIYRTSFVATNLTDAILIGQAVPSVTPLKAATHLRKTECFCFVSQQFEGAERKDMPVQFMVDPALPAHIETITLSYTYFRNEGATAALR